MEVELLQTYQHHGMSLWIKVPEFTSIFTCKILLQFLATTSTLIYAEFLPDWFSFIPFYLRYIYIESLVSIIRALTWPTAERQMPGPNQGRSLHHLCLVYKQQLVHNNESVQKKFKVIVKLAYLIQIKISGMNNRITIWKCIIKQRVFFLWVHISLVSKTRIWFLQFHAMLCYNLGCIMLSIIRDINNINDIYVIMV